MVSKMMGGIDLSKMPKDAYGELGNLLHRLSLEQQ